MTIDQLIVTLLLDSSGFAKGQKDATTAANKMADDVTKAATKAEKAQTESNDRVVKSAQTTAQGIELANQKAAQSFEKVLGAGLALLAMFAGARSLEDFARKIINLEAAVGRLAHNFGSTPERISSIGRAAERMGGSFGGAVSGIQSLSDAFEELRTTGNTSIMEPLARLQAMGGKKITFGQDWHENLLSIADDLKALDAKDPKLADYLGRQILHDDTLVNIAKGGREGVLAEEAKSTPISAADTAAAQTYQETWESLSQSIQHVGQTIVTDFAPAATAAIGKMDDWIKKNQGWVETGIAKSVAELTNWLRDHKQEIENFGSALATMASAAGSIASAFGKQSPMAQALEIFILLLARVLGPLNLILASARALGALRLGSALGGGAAGAAGGAGAGGGAASGTGLGLRGALAGFNLFELAQGMPEQLKKAETDNAPVDDSVKREAGMGDAMRNAWGWMKDKLGLGSTDSRTKDDIADTAKATGEMRDLLKAQKDAGGTEATGGAGFGGVSDHHASPSIRYNRQHTGDRGGSDVGGRASKMSGDVASRAKAAMARLEAKGWSHEAAAAAVGNAQQESGVRSDGPLGDTARFGTGDDAAHGMFQWRGQRFRDLKAFSQARGTSWQDFNTQVDFFDEESKKYGSSDWRKTNDIVHANQGMKRFEGYGDNSFGTRLANARQIAAGRSDGATYPAGTSASRASTALASLPHPVSHTYDSAANSLMKAYHESSHRGPSGPVKVDLTDSSAEKVGRTFGHASLDARARGAVDAKHASWARSATLEVHHSRMAAAASSVTHQDNSSETHVGHITIQTAATDAKGIAADISPQLQRSQAAARSNYGLA